MILPCRRASTPAYIAQVLCSGLETLQELTLSVFGLGIGFDSNALDTDDPPAAMLTPRLTR